MAETTLLEQLTGVQIDDASQAAILGAGFAAVIIAGQLLFKIIRVIRAAVARPGRRPLRADMVATVIGAGLVLALSIEGMWRFFGGIGMPYWARIAFAAVFEICLLAVALRARHTRLLRQARRDALIELRSKRSDEESSAAALDAQIASIRLRGINDALVWVFAGIIGILAALEAPTPHEQVARFLVPFIAATMWELALGADVEDQRVTAAAAHWIDRVKTGFAAAGRSLVSVAVKFGWVPPTSADATEQYREKQMTKLVDVSHQIHTADGKRKPRLLDKQRRLILGLQARGQWSGETLTELGQRLDVLYRAEDLTAPSTVRAPAAARPKPAPAPVPLPAVEPRPTAERAPVLPAPRGRAARAEGKRLQNEQKHAALLAAWTRLRDERGTDTPPCRDLAAAAGVGKSLAAKWLKDRITDMDNGQEAAA